MWILPNNLIQSHSLKVTEELSEALSLLENELNQSLLVRSKPMPSRTLSQRWKKGHWIRTLFGRMPKPSLASNFLEKWISSQEDSHVSHSVQQVEEKPMKIQDICGLLALEPSISSDLKEFCLKMSKDLLAQSSAAMGGATQKGHQYCSMSVESWKDEVTRQRGEYSQRVKQARLIRESESSSSDTTRKGRTRPANLREQVNPRACEIYKEVNWPTPTQAMHKREGSLEYHQKELERGNQMALTNVVPLHEAKNWPTPAQRDYKDSPGTSMIGAKGFNRTNSTMPLAVFTEEGVRPNGLQDPDNHKEEWKSLELNANWVEQLMGLTTGSTDLGSWGTE